MQEMAIEFCKEISGYILVCVTSYGNGDYMYDACGNGVTQGYVPCTAYGNGLVSEEMQYVIQSC